MQFRSLWETKPATSDRVECKQDYKDIADFYNTTTQADGDATMTKISGGVPSNDNDSDVHFGDYVDKTLWKTQGIHAYITYQTTTWDYRNAYKPLRSLGKDEGTYQYIKAGGNEIQRKNTKVTDVQITKDGEYTISLDGVDLSAANQYKDAWYCYRYRLQDLQRVRNQDYQYYHEGRWQGSNRCSI